MQNQFNLTPTKEELVFARRRFLHDIEQLNNEPLAVLSFPSYWNIAHSDDLGEARYCDIYEKLSDIHALNTILFSRYTHDQNIWNKAVITNRQWIQSLTDEQKAELKTFDNYKYWQPFLMVKDYMSINGYLNLFPNVASAEKIPDIVKKYENPNSPDKLPGAVNIDTHDAIHVLLGRGALQADEAFVIGFTMGGASNKLTDEHMRTFIHAFTEEYPAPFKMNPKVIPSYLIGVATGLEYFKETGIDLSKFDFSAFRDQPIDVLRIKLGINIDLLSEVYKKENTITPSGRAAKRNQTLTHLPEGSRTSPRATIG